MKGATGLLAALLGCALVFAMALPAVTAEWGQYVNSRFGYQIRVPPGFVGQGEPDNADGQLFIGPAHARLSVWGGYLLGTFADEANRRISGLRQDGWTLASRTVTPGWGNWSGTRGSRMVFVHAISGCEGSRYAIFQLEYGRADIAAYRRIADRLSGALLQARCP